MTTSAAGNWTSPNDPVPAPTRPQLPQGYGAPADDGTFLPWSYVVEQMVRARNYWVSTAGANGRPHAIPFPGRPST